MADVALRFTTTGTSEAIQSLNQVAQSTQRFASTTQQTITQARVATQSFNFVLFDMARIARATGGAAGKEFANSLEGAVIAVSTARGAVAAYRGVLQSQDLITKAVTASTVALNTALKGLLGPWGLILLALAAVMAGLVLYKEHLDATRTSTEQLTIHGISLHRNLEDLRGDWNSLAVTVHDLNTKVDRSNEVFLNTARAQAFASARAAEMAQHEKDVAEAARKAAETMARAIDKWLIDSVPMLRGQQAMADRWVAIGKAAEEAARKQHQAGVDSEKALFDIGIQAKNTYTETQNTADDAAAVQAQSAEDVAMMAKNVWVESENAQVDATLDAQQRIHDSVASGLVGILTGTSTFADLWASIWQQVVTQIIGQIGLIQIAVSAITGFLGGIFPFLFLQRGGSFVATRPTPLMVGEAGAERVSVSPLAGSPATGGGGATIVLQGPTFFDDITYARFIRGVARELTSGPVGRVG